MKKKSTGRKIWNVITTILVVIVVIIALLLVGARLFGLNVYTVISGSMVPTYNVGDLIYVKKVPAEEIEVGDPITFVLNEDLVVATHRVIEIDKENKHFYTKGDANSIADASPVHFNNYIGKPIFKIPFLGYLSAWAKEPPGMFIAIGIAIVLVLMVFLPDVVNKGKEKKDKE